MNVIAKQQELVNFIWGIANLLRGSYRPPQPAAAALCRLDR